MERTSSGGSRESYFVDVARPGGEVVEALLRVEAGGSFTGTEINVSKEAVVYRALGSAGVRVPKVYGLAPGGAAVLLERVAGRGDLGETPEEQHDTWVDFVDVIADMHNVDVEKADLPGFPRPTTPEDHARLDLQLWARLAEEHVVGLDPLARYAGAFLRANAPTTVARTCIVQGDTGPGNFVADRGRVTALCDMEFSHIGDPMDDIAWMLSRGFDRYGVDPAPFLEQYTARSGIPIDWRSVHYYDIAVQYRCVITTSLAVSRGGGARGWPPYLLVTERYLLALAAGLSRYAGVEEAHPVVPDVAETPRSAWYDALMSSLRAAVKALPDPEQAEDTRNHQILVHYLRAYDRIGGTIDELNLHDLHESLGVVGEGSEFDKVVEDAGAAGDESALRFLLRRTYRNALLWQSILERRRPT
ncbi:MAG: phosphotransferase [Acidobacteria bacterium]|nr:phosphotransferase [Acidobacteriota bacterium]